MKRSTLHKKPRNYNRFSLSDTPRMGMPLVLQEDGLKNLFMNSPASIAFLSGESFTIETANKKFSELGSGNLTMIGKPFFRLFPELKQQGFLELFQQAYATNKPLIFKQKRILFPNRMKNPSHQAIKYYDIFLQPYQDELGATSGLFFHGIDVTDHVLTKQEIQRIKEQYEVTAHASNTGTFIWELQSDTIVWSPELAHVYGRDIPELITNALTWYKMIHPDNLDRLKMEIEEAKNTHKPLDVEFRIHLPDGRTRWILQKGKVDYDSSGNPMRIVGVHVDITKQKKAEEELRMSQEMFQSLHDANIVGIAYIDEKGSIKSANDAFYSMLRYTKKEIGNNQLNWFDLIAHGHKQREHETVKELHLRRRALPSEKELVRKDKTTVPVIVGYAVPDTHTKQMIVLVMDITERKRLEERKDEFLGIASHELKTPLTSIKGYTQILERIIYQMGDERLNQYLKKTNNYIERLNSLISELLDVSKIQAGKLKLEYSTFSFDELVQESINMMKYTNSSHTVIARGNVQDEIHADKHRLEQVFVNLISNAIKYSPKADTVVVHTKRSNGVVEVTVEDFGIGIAQEQIQNLFKRFYRVESSSQQFSGLGIGLYISSEIVRRHGGKMDVESELGKGSRFRFSIPVTNSPKHSTIEA